MAQAEGEEKKKDW